jgi:hypothetical protein
MAPGCAADQTLNVLPRDWQANLPGGSECRSRSTSVRPTWSDGIYDADAEAALYPGTNAFSKKFEIHRRRRRSATE